MGFEKSNLLEKRESTNFASSKEKDASKLKHLEKTSIAIFIYVSFANLLVKALGVIGERVLKRWGEPHRKLFNKKNGLKNLLKLVSY